MSLCDYPALTALSVVSEHARTPVKTVSHALKSQLDALNAYLAARQIVRQDYNLKDLEIFDPFPQHPRLARSEEYATQGLQTDPRTFPWRASSTPSVVRDMISEFDMEMAQYWRYLGRVYKSFKTAEDRMFDCLYTRDSQGKEVDYTSERFNFSVHEFTRARGELYFHIKHAHFFGCMTSITSKTVDEFLSHESTAPCIDLLRGLAICMQVSTKKFNEEIDEVFTFFDRWHKGAVALDKALDEADEEYEDIRGKLYPRSGDMIPYSEDSQKLEMEKRS